MTTEVLIITLGKTLIGIVAAFLLRERWPHRYLIGLPLCILFPAWGHIYLKTKHNWVPWFIFISINNGIAKTNPESFTPFIILGCISAAAMYLRILPVKKVESPCKMTVSSEDRNYIKNLNAKLDAAGVESERDII